MNKIYETSKKTLCNSRYASLGATRIYEQSVKTSSESSNDGASLKTTRHVR